MSSFEDSMAQYRRILDDLRALAQAPNLEERQASAVRLITEYLNEVVENREIAKAFSEAVNGTGTA